MSESTREGMESGGTVRENLEIGAASTFLTRMRCNNISRRRTSNIGSAACSSSEVQLDSEASKGAGAFIA